MTKALCRRLARSRSIRYAGFQGFSRQGWQLSLAPCLFCEWTGEGLLDAIDIILAAAGSTEALRGLYQAGKKRDRKYSMAFYCAKAGISSTGYLSDVVNGKRKLHSKYGIGIAKAFGLSREEARCLRLMVDLDNTADPSQRARIEGKIALAKKVLRIAKRPLAKLYEMFFAMEVFCAFGLYKNRPTQEQLVSCFGQAHAADVGAALAVLEGMGLVRRNDGIFEPIDDQVFFAGDAGPEQHVKFLKQAMAHAVANLDRWFEERALAHFHSSIISVKRSEYLKLLPQLKSRFVDAEASLESSDADLLIRFNVQMYPS